MDPIPHIVCAVGGHADELYRLRVASRPGQSVPARWSGSAGGCALNLACAVAALGARATHAGLRGDDAGGAAVAGTLARHGVGDAALVPPDVATGRYAAMVEPGGTLALAAAAMDAYARMAELERHEPFREALAGADALVLDANGPPGAAERLAALRGTGSSKRTRLILLATSPRKAPVLAPLLGEADVLHANEEEWDVLGAAAPGARETVALAFVTRGAHGARVVAQGETLARAAPPPGPLVDVVGGGDAFAAGALHAWLAGAEPAEALERGLALAARCVAREGALGWLKAP